MHLGGISKRMASMHKATATLAFILLLSCSPHVAQCFKSQGHSSVAHPLRIKSNLNAAPKRLDENVSGMLYVNDRCINCAACSNFAPTVFERNSKINKHVVFNQPSTDNQSELELARAALAACPVAAIRVESDTQNDEQLELKKNLSIQPKNGESGLFPRSIYPMQSTNGESIDIGVYYLGHHNDASFGAIPYLALGKSKEGKDISVMVDVPRFSASSVRAVKSLAPNGPDYMFLTHVDDTADHNQWKHEFPNLKRIFHSAELGRHNWIGDLTLENVEVLLRGKNEDKEHKIKLWDLEGNGISSGNIHDIGEEKFLIIHTPGHSPGSISLLFRPKEQPDPVMLQSSSEIKLNYPRGVLFTGDTYAWTTRENGHMSGFPRYGNNLHEQASTLKKIGTFAQSWDIIAPGHGHPRFYLKVDDVGGESSHNAKLEEIHVACEELFAFQR